jgi:hypothetical protein
MRETILATGRRVLAVYAGIVLLFFVWHGGGLWQGSLPRVLLTFGILLSVAAGVEFLIFQGAREVSEAERNGVVTIYHYYGLAAPAIFAGSQTVAAAQLVLGWSSYLYWLLPALAYLFLIGLIGWRRFDRPAMFIADSVRALVLLLLALLERSAR